ncbi:MAG: AAA family ATPase [candidate division KSB1 bacterium]|nr:AAA family ATPase [candidate division KSB1 bacterium]MDZ7367907.1 AAA family ATPase [candidate division KSB1 bacterium]MDZ7406526.1 AAA family ATPase [candidate division KSB1 bacterium]
MKLREIIVKNFRCLADAVIPIHDTTVLVGENNSGKTALLDALKIALPRSQQGRGTPFDEYDYYMSKVGDSPQTSDGIVIELWFREDKSDEWPSSLVQALTDIIQTDPVKDLDSIGLRLSSKFDPLTTEPATNWEFLTLDGQPLGGKGASSGNLTRFLSYIRLFYLSALRDSDDEFSPRSQFWGRILRDLKISEEQRKTLSEELAKLNHELLKADPRLEQVRATLDKIQKIMASGIGQKTSIQALPLKPWDLMSKAEVVIKARGSEVDFPLSRHGQGIQSLAVLFLFQAYIDVLLKPTFQPETEAILALEEPEAHLHPQATRALAANLGEVKSQKIVSSHSPYFIQEIPFAQIRMFRRNGPFSKVLYVKRSFSTKVPNTPKVLEFCKNNAPKFDYHEGTGTLCVNGKLEEQEYQKLLKIYPKQTDAHVQLKRLYSESQIYLSDGDLADLDTYAKRIRGEVLFARAWLLCEGQSEYLLLRYFAELLEKPLDQYGITVIDFQNNGSPGAFVGLARTFEIPWIMVCDNDAAGHEFVKQVKTRGLLPDEIKELVRPLPESGMDLEMFLIKNGFVQEYLEILAERNISLAKMHDETGFQDELVSKIRADKTGYTIALLEKLRRASADSTRVPPFFAKIITDVVAKAA